MVVWNPIWKSLLKTIIWIGSIMSVNCKTKQYYSNNYKEYMLVIVGESGKLSLKYNISSY